MTQIVGEVAFTAVQRQVTASILRIRLVDVSRADAAAIPVAETLLRDVAVTSADDRYGFALEVPELDPRGSYALEAHLDVEGTGETSVGDYRTMEHYGVSPSAMGGTVTLRLRLVE